MRLRARLDTSINARIVALMPAAGSTVWDKAGVVVLIEQAKFTSAGGTVGGAFERLFSVTGLVRIELRTDDLKEMGLAEELVSDLIRNPVFLAGEAVSLGATTETARAKLSEMRILPREGTLIHSLALTLTGEVLRHIGPGVMPSEVNVPLPLDGVAA